MDSRQHGSRAGRSTLSQLLLHFDLILKALEEGTHVDTIYLDFAKAFHKVDHGLLLHKLKTQGIKGKMGRWIQNFLYKRSNQVLVDGKMSSIFFLISGIPQGSVLGPFLFLAFIAEIRENIKCEAFVYVDDTKTVKEIESEDDVEKHQEDINTQMGKRKQHEIQRHQVCCYKVWQKPKSKGRHNIFHRGY